MEVELIVRARQDISKLLDEVERLQKENKKQLELLKGVRDDAMLHALEGF